MRRARSLRWRLTLAMLLVFVLSLARSIVLSTQETRQEEAVGLEEGANGALVGIVLDEAIDWLLVFAPLAVASFVLIWLIGWWSLRPLARVSREAAAIGPTNPSGRVSIETLPREVRAMVDAVNGALARLDDAYAAQRRFTADAAHELRTPLAVLNLRLQRAKLDAAVDWPAVERDLAHMNRTVGQLMELARKEDPAWLDDATGMRPINLSRVVREAAAAVLPFAEENGRPLEVDVPDRVPALGRSEDLRDAVRNLLENALFHGAGAIRVSVRQRSGGTGRRAVIEVSDEGPGIADELREEVFERFRKAAPTSGRRAGACHRPAGRPRSRRRDRHPGRPRLSRRDLLAGADVTPRRVTLTSGRIMPGVRPTAPAQRHLARHLAPLPDRASPPLGAPPACGQAARED